MAKRAASTASRTEPSSSALNEHLSSSAQQQLAALRGALESRLAALEEVLADPGRGESLAGLILDLSRIATEEAQVAASQACIATRAEADKEIATLRVSAKSALDGTQAALKATEASLDQERALGTDLRRAVDQAQLENHKQADLLKARDQLEANLRTDRQRLEAEVVKQQSIVADAQRAAGELQRAAADAKQQLETERRSSADWQSQLQAERASGAELGRSAHSAAARLEAVERELADERAAHEAAVADVSDERAAHQAVVAELTDARAAHQAVVAELTDARAAGQAVAAQLADARAAHQAVAAELADARAAHQAVAAELAGAGATYQAVVAELAEARAAHDEELRGVRAAHDAVVKELAGARGAHEAVAADLEHERKAAPNRDHAHAQLQSQLEAERATVADLRQAAARAEELSATLSRESSGGHEAHEEAALLQTSLADAQRALADAQAQLETDRAAMVEVRQLAEYTDQQLASARSNEAQTVADHQKLSAQLDALSKERTALIDELAAARSAIAQSHELRPEPVATPAPPPVEPHPPKAKAKAHATASAKKQQVEPEEGWQSVRLAVRYMFSTELSVQVNGNPARIFDISVSGCQLLSPTALKPNQMVKIVLPDVPPVTCSGKVIWTRLEPMAVGQPLGYRAGVRFTKADDLAIETFAARYASPA